MDWECDSLRHQKREEEVLLQGSEEDHRKRTSFAGKALKV